MISCIIDRNVIYKQKLHDKMTNVRKKSSNSQKSEPTPKKQIKEKHVADFIKDKFQGEDIVFDKAINNGCSRRRPDIFIEKYTHSIIIEVDENQHHDYTCENKRMMELFQDLGSRPIVFIRFNPDEYINKNDESVKSCFKYHQTLGVPIVSDETLWNRRLDALENIITFHINNIPLKEVTIETLFYNEF